MKKLSLMSAFLLLAMMSFAQSAQPAQDFAIAQVDNLSHDFGKIKQGVPVSHEFTFVNKGKIPLIITNAQPSCGCTVPSWTRDPIPPGGSGNVKATFNAAASGAFDKTVTVTANVEGGIILLRIRGEVQESLPND